LSANQAWLLQKTSLANTRAMGNHIGPDEGLDCVLFARGNDAPLMQNTPKRLKMNFAGRVTNVPTHGAIPFCKVWGVQFFVDGKSYSSLASEFCLPSWLVPIMHKEDAHTKHIGLVVANSVDTFNFKWTQCGRVSKVISIQPPIQP
jgi:hypothetical protein